MRQRKLLPGTVQRLAGAYGLMQGEAIDAGFVNVEPGVEQMVVETVMVKQPCPRLAQPVLVTLGQGLQALPPGEQAGLRSGASPLHTGGRATGREADSGTQAQQEYDKAVASGWALAGHFGFLLSLDGTDWAGSRTMSSARETRHHSVITGH